MTIDELIAQAAKLGGWYLTAVGEIRSKCDFGVACPMTAVANVCVWVLHPTLQAKLGLSARDYWAIANAADGATHGPIRRRMLAAFGLKEVLTS